MIPAADYIIIGGGTAGCVLANRLSADASCTVAMIEAGPEDTSMWISMPAGVAKLFQHPTLNWRYQTEPEPALGGKTLYWPRGKVIGGTSSINGMTFVRGHPADYDAWAAIAGSGWSWQSVLPYFKRFEASAIGEDALRGRDGPMRLGTVAAPHRLSRDFLASCVAAGIPANPDYNGAAQEGASYTQVMMNEGARVSAASAYLSPVRQRRGNLHVLTGSLVRRIVIEGGRATGVELECKGIIEKILARREVLLCAGTVASPQLLMLSGIGPRAELAKHGIDTVVDAPEVGRKLQEHVRAQLVLRTRIPSYNREARGLRLAGHVLNYFLRRQGLLAETASQVNGFFRSSPDVERPDLQLVFRPSSGDYRDGGFVIHKHQGLMSMVSLLRPKSRGHIALKSADPHAPPAIHVGHLTAPEDAEPLIRGVRILRKVFATPPIANDVSEELRPGPDIESDAALRSYVFAGADSTFHAVGTCAMGIDAASVTTPELRVRGVDGLRVVDASVMPLVPSGNTNAAVLMIAERAADLILGKAAPPSRA